MRKRNLLKKCLVKKGKRWLALLMCLSMTSMMAPTTVWADDEPGENGTVKTINLDATVLRPIDGKWDANTGNLVYFGKYDTNADDTAEPIAYRVLASPGTQTTKDSEDQSVDGLLLDCNTTLENVKFFNDSIYNNNSWNECDLKEWLNQAVDDTYHFYGNSSVFSNSEKAAVANTTLAAREEYSVGFYTYYDYAATNHVFLLSAEEANSLYANNDARKKTGRSNYWWLRSGYTCDDIAYVGYYNPYYGIFFDDVCSSLGVSPALNVDLSKVLFVSESVESEASGAFDKSSGLALVGDGASIKSWKLTLLDRNKTVIVTSGEDVNRSDTNEGVTITVPYTYTDSAAIDNEKVSQISVMITDKAYDTDSAQVLYYGAL